MSLCRYLPVPSDRMGIIWSLLSVKDSIILEYGAGQPILVWAFMEL